MSNVKSTVTKADIVEKVYQKIGFSKKEASELVELVFGQLKDTLCTGEKVKISGFGNLWCAKRKSASVATHKLVIKLKSVLDGY